MRRATAFPSRLPFVLLMLAALLGLGGCTAGAVVGAGAVTGVAAYQERGIDGVARDTKLAAEIHETYFRHDTTLSTNVGVEVYESRALLTGLVPGEDLRAEAVRLAWEIEGIKDVINEIQLRSEEGVVDFAWDAWITAQLKSKITVDQEIYSINYSIETVNRVIYLIGIAQDQAELDRVIAYARDIDRVRRVTSHVRVKEPAEDKAT